LSDETTEPIPFDRSSHFIERVNVSLPDKTVKGTMTSRIVATRDMESQMSTLSELVSMIEQMSHNLFGTWSKGGKLI